MKTEISMDFNSHNVSLENDDLLLKEKALAEKISIQLEVMIELGYLPADHSSLTMEEQLAAFELWTKDVEGKPDTSNSMVFHSLFQSIIDDPEKLRLLKNNRKQMVQEIASKLQPKENF